VLDLLEIEGFLLVVFGLTSLRQSGDLFLFLEGLVHALGDVLLLADHVPADLGHFFFRFLLNTLSFLQGLSQALTGSLFSRGKLRFLLLHLPKLRVPYLIDLALVFFHLGQVRLGLRVSLLQECLLRHQGALSRLVEKVRTISKPIIAELLSDALGIGTLWPLLDEVVEEAEDLKVEAFQAVVFVVV